MRIILICLTLVLASCAHTTFYSAGKPILQTQADIRGLTYQDGALQIHVDELNHSQPTLAGGHAIGGGATAIGSAAAGLGTALLAR